MSRVGDLGARGLGCCPDRGDFGSWGNQAEGRVVGLWADLVTSLVVGLIFAAVVILLAVLVLGAWASCLRLGGTGVSGG